MHCVLKMRSLKVKFYLLTVIVLAVYLFLFYIFLEIWIIKKHSPTVITSVSLPNVFIHLDLKGAPPKLKYLESLLPILKEQGATGLIIEYEDMFPYEGKLANISARNCYNKSDLKAFLKRAVAFGFQIVPLIQTFGHMEHVLKLKEFMHLREIPQYPDSLCPSKPESRALTMHMLEQVIDFHESVSRLEYIHIGFDEVYHINKCQQCTSKLKRDIYIFIDYLNFLSGFIKQISPDTTILIWDDMFRELPPLEWNQYKPFENVEPVVWSYSPSMNVPHISLFNYHKKFKNIWIASAFKGADGRTAILPSLKDRVENHYGWMNFIKDYKFGGDSKVYGFKGIILTGWSRYSHMDPLCELLPAAIPSLLASLITVDKFKTGVPANDTDLSLDDFVAKHIFSTLAKDLKCDIDMPIPLNQIDLVECNFENVTFYNLTKTLQEIHDSTMLEFNNVKSGISAVEYYSKVRNINLNHAFNYLLWCDTTLDKLVNVERSLVNAMKNYYENDVIEEFTNYKTFNLKKMLKRCVSILNDYVITRVWERRPFQIVSE